MTSQYFVRPDRASVEDFNIFCQQQVNKQDYPLVSEVAEEVLIYDHDVLAQAAATNKHAVLSELHQGLSYGPGVLVVRGLYQDMDVIDRASAVFETIMADESRTRVQADHFSRAGNNGRIWNALQKLAERSPQTFCDYYANEMLG
jgi:ectoine hydroxylase-related dioxygenase (phytanoyl-CoA dioxygenase family)